jgi:N-acetylglucosamine-6-sulfatase
MEELYNLAQDPAESRNLAQDPENAVTLADMRVALANLLVETGADPDPMPIDQGIKGELPEESFR